LVDAYVGITIEAAPTPRREEPSKAQPIGGSASNIRLTPFAGRDLATRRWSGTWSCRYS